MYVTVCLRIDNDSFAIGGRLWGRRDGPVSHRIVAWPDWGLTSETFDNIGQEFHRSGWSFLALDPPGHGQSDALKAFEWYQEHNDACVLWKAVDALGWQGQCSIVGHGPRGAAVALLAASGWPDRTFSLALLGSSFSFAGTAGSTVLLDCPAPRAMWHAYHEQKGRLNLGLAQGAPVQQAQSQPVYFTEDQLREVLRSVQAPVLLARCKHRSCSDVVFEDRCACVRSLTHIDDDTFEPQHISSSSNAQEVALAIVKWIDRVDASAPMPSKPKGARRGPPGAVPGVSSEDLAKRKKDAGLSPKGSDQPPVRVWDPQSLLKLRSLKMAGNASRQLRLPILDGTYVAAAEAWGNSESVNRILAVSGYLDNAGTWAGLGPYLAAAGWYVVAIDEPGNGLSSHYPAHAAYVDYEESVSLVHVMDALHWESAVLMGHSRGAGIVTIAAGAFPDRIRGVIVVESLYGVYSDGASISAALRDSVDYDHKNHGRRTRTFDSLRELIEHNYHNPTFPKSYEAAVAISTRHATLRPDGKWSFTHDVRTYGHIQAFHIEHKQVLSFLEAIECPMLAINVERRTEMFTLPYIEKLFPDRPDVVRLFRIKSQEFMDMLHSRQQCLRNLTTRDMAGGHHLHADDPAQLWSLVKPWLEQLVQGTDAGRDNVISDRENRGASKL